MTSLTRSFNVIQALKEAKPVVYLQTAPDNYEIVRGNEISADGYLPERSRLGFLFDGMIDGRKYRRLIISIKHKKINTEVTMINMSSNKITHYTVLRDDLRGITNAAYA